MKVQIYRIVNDDDLENIKSSSPSCPKTRTERQCRILEAFSKLAETSRRGTGSAIGDPEQTSPADQPFRPTGAPELLCGVAGVITEQAAQSLTTSHLPVRTADAFFRFEQRLPETLEPGESIKALTSGVMDGNTWLVICTDRRVLFLDKGLIYGLKQMEIPLDGISSVSQRMGLVLGSIQILGAGLSGMKVNNIPKDDVAKFAKAVQTARRAFSDGERVTGP